MTSCDRSPRKRSGSLTLSPSCHARSLPRSRRLGSLSVAPSPSSFSLASARLRSPAFSRRLVLDLAACASGKERERNRRVVAECQREKGRKKGRRENDNARGRERNGMQRAQAPRTYILTGAICEAVKAPPASTDFRGEKEEASEPSVPSSPPLRLRFLRERNHPRCTLSEQGVPGCLTWNTYAPLCLSRYLLRMNAREIFFNGAAWPSH